MHIYIYDSFLNNKKYDSIVAKIETRITDLGLNGKIIRLSMLQSLNDSIHDEIKRGAKTIVAVGGTKLLHQCLNAIMHSYSDSNLITAVPLGFIPVNSKDSSLSNKLAIPRGVDACNVLSARRIKNFDLGEVNNHYFLTEAIIDTEGTTTRVDDSYSIEINEVGEIGIINMLNSFELPGGYQSSPEDGRLEFCIKTKKSNKFFAIGNKENTSSVFSFSNLLVENTKNKSLLLDSVTKVQTPAKIKLSQKKLGLIVGKGSNF